jgi:hypothetical protein
VPVAVNCWVVPATLVAVAGVTAIEDRVAAVTVRVAVPDLPLKVAVMVAEPAALAVARPLLATVAVVVLEELQVTCVVMFWVVESEYVPVAVNCWVVPATLVAVAGVTAMEDRVAAVTVRVAVPDLPLKAAVMVAEPAATAVARPLLLIVAADVGSEDQVTCVVMSRLVPSEYVPEAANCWVVPATLVAVAGVTAIEFKVAAVTVRVVVSDFPP